MRSITPIVSYRQTMQWVRAARDHQDARVLPWQAAIKVGDKFVRRDIGYQVIGEVIDPIAAYEDPSDPDAQWEKDRWASPPLKNIRLARCYSQFCPQGEYGNVHVEEVAYVVNNDVFITLLDTIQEEAKIHKEQAEVFCAVLESDQLGADLDAGG